MAYKSVGHGLVSRHLSGCGSPADPALAGASGRVGGWAGGGGRAAAAAGRRSGRAKSDCWQGAERQRNERSADAEHVGAAERRSGGGQ